MDISIPTPPDFSFRRTVISHGWYDLTPFRLDREAWQLSRVLDVGGRAPVRVVIYEGEDSVGVRTPHAKLGARAEAQVVRDVRHMLRLDDDLSGFYAAMSDDAEFAWIARAGAGRMLRAPTVYEDLVKTICTTNCSWSLTKKMLANLVEQLGHATRDGDARAFPIARAMADAPRGFYREEMRAGYRAPYLRELAERVASGALDVESWLTSDAETGQLRREMKSVKGVGDYAAENLLKLVGRYDVLALDSWVRAKFARLHGRGRATPDSKIARRYSRFRTWRGLALWCDMTRDWLDDDGAGRARE